MKPIFKPLLRLKLRPASAALRTYTVSPAVAASDSWIPGANGSYATPGNWTGGNVPNGSADVATVEGANSVVAFNQAVTLRALNLALSASGGTPTFNQTGGSLSVGTLGFGGGGEALLFELGEDEGVDGVADAGAPLGRHIRDGGAGYGAEGPVALRIGGAGGDGEEGHHEDCGQ